MSLFPPETMPRTINIGVLSGTDYLTDIQAAIDEANAHAPAAGSEWVVLVWPGAYTGPFTLRPFVHVVAVGSREETIITCADSDVVAGANNAILEGFTLSVTAPTAARTLINCGATSPTVRKCRFVGSAAQAITAVSHTTGSPVVEDCETGNNIAILFYTNGPGTLNARRITSTATAAILSSAACGAATINVHYCDFGAGTITLTAGSTAILTMTHCRGSGTLTHQATSTIWIRSCSLYNANLVFGAAGINSWANIFHTNLFGGTVTNNGIGRPYFYSCQVGDVTNNSTGWMMFGSCDVGTVTQAAAAGRIDIRTCSVLDLSCDAGGVIYLHGGCEVVDIVLNNGSIRWVIEQNRWKVVCGLAASGGIAMKIQDIINVSVAGEPMTIEVGQGTYTEQLNLAAFIGSSLYIKALEGPEVTTITQADANAMLASSAATIEGFTVRVTAPTAARTCIVCGATSPTIKNCKFVGAAAQTITAISHTTGSPTIEECKVDAGTNISVFLSTLGAGTATVRRCILNVSTAILTGAACGAATITATYCEFVSGTISTTAGGTPTVNLSYCNIQACTINTASVLTIRHCNLAGLNVIGAGAIASVYDSVTSTISTGAGATLRFYGRGCYWPDINSNPGVITWQVAPNHWRVIAGTANMKVADAIAAATAGVRSTIEIGPGVLAESSLTMKNLVDLVGDDPENCQIVASSANPILVIPGITVTIRGIRVENSGAGPAVRCTGGTLTIRQADIASALNISGGAVLAISAILTAIDMESNPASSLTIGEGCEISGAITNIHASATFIVPRKRLGVGLGAPGLLADATQMDSVAGAGVPINQAPATRTTTDWPRSVKVVHTNANSAFPYNITLTGTAMLKGALVAVTEVIAVTGAGTFRGVVAWHNISNWTSSGNITAGDTVALQFDSRQGLEHRLRDATHLLACRKSPGGAAPLYRTPGSFTLNLTQYTIEETGVPVVAGDNYEYFIVKG